MIDPSKSAEAAVAELVREYCSAHRHPTLPPFKVHPVQNWKGWWGSAQSYRPGCYVIYAENGDVIYVGKASLGASLGSRLAVHERDKHPKWEGARLVQMIEVSEAFEAPSLEEYMLGRLATRLNRIGINMKAI